MKHLLTAGLFCLAGAAQAATPPELTVASFNLYCFQVDDGNHVMPFAERAEHIARYIVDSQVDVIGFQEVCTPLDGGESNLDIVLRLVREQARRSNQRATFHARTTMTHVSWGRYNEGIGFISRLDIRDVDSQSLQSLDGFFPRRVLAATVATPIGSMRFHVAHLTAVWGDPGARGEQSRAQEIRTLKQYAEGSAGSHAFSVVVGDFNSSPQDEPYQIMTSNAEGIRFWDALPGVGGTIPSWDVGNRIDYVYANGNLRWIRARKVLGEPINGRYLSDHVGVEARFSRR